MRRYKFLTKDDIYEALNKLRAAFLAAKDGTEVEEIIKGVLTSDERMKIGRRILTAQLIEKRETYDSIRSLLRVGKQTVLQVQKLKSLHPKCFKLINRREEKVEKIFKQRAYIKIGGSKMIYKRKEYTGFSRKEVKR